MTLVEWLLVAVGVLLLVLVVQVSTLSSFMKSFATALGGDLGHAQQQRQEMAASIAECATHAEQLRDALTEVVEVMEVIKRYKLPGPREQKELDELAFEEEHSRRVALALAGKPDKDDA